MLVLFTTKVTAETKAAMYAARRPNETWDACFSRLLAGATTGTTRGATDNGDGATTGATDGTTLGTTDGATSLMRPAFDESRLEPLAAAIGYLMQRVDELEATGQGTTSGITLGITDNGDGTTSGITSGITDNGDGTTSGITRGATTDKPRATDAELIEMLKAGIKNADICARYAVGQARLATLRKSIQQPGEPEKPTAPLDL